MWHLVWHVLCKNSSGCPESRGVKMRRRKVGVAEVHFYVAVTKEHGQVWQTHPGHDCMASEGMAEGVERDAWQSCPSDGCTKLTTKSVQVPARKDGKQRRRTMSKHLDCLW